MNSRILKAILSTVVIIVYSSVAEAEITDRYFRDQDVMSPGMQYRITAISPDNAGDRPRPFADDFTYTLYNIETGDIVYTRQQPDGESSPMAVHLDDSGWCVIWTGGHSLLVLDPSSGEVAFEQSIIDLIPAEERRRHVHMTTAGYMWSTGSRWWFMEHEDDILFILRTGWGRIIAISLVDLEVRLPDDQELYEQIQKEMAAKTLGLLRSAIANPPGEDDRSAWRGTHHAILWAGQMRLQESVPMLREFESLSAPQRCTRRFSFDEPEPGLVYPFSERCDLFIRRAAQWSLRQNGHTPSSLPAFIFEPTGSDLTVPLHPNQLQNRVMSDNIDVIGLSPLELVQMVGTPDDQARMGRYWDYDIDEPVPHTVRVMWGRDDRVEKSLRIEPPTWVEPHARYESVIGNS